MRLPAAFESVGEFLADVRSLESARADLLLLGEGELDHELLLAAMAAATVRVRLHHPAPGETLRRLAGGRLTEQTGGWREVPFPADRVAWKATLARADEDSVEGVIVEMDPRLLDLLRNPDIDDDRATDLQLAQG